MDKAIKCLLVNVSDVLITEIIELSVEYGEPDWKLINPYQIDSDGNLTPWPAVSDQREIKIISDNVLTVVDPKEEIIQKYLELTTQ
jgi:hypothetical protein